MNYQNLSRDEYIQVANNCGIYDEIDVELAYRLYIATTENDEKKVAKATSNLYWNNFYRFMGMFN